MISYQIKQRSKDKIMEVLLFMLFLVYDVVYHVIKLGSLDEHHKTKSGTLQCAK